MEFTDRRQQFWEQVKEFCPPQAIGVVVHSVGGAARSKGTHLSQQDMARSIENNGLIAPVNYSNLSRTGQYWDSCKYCIDFVFLTETKPTEESDANRDSALSGFPLRDAVQPFNKDSVPIVVRNLYPDVSDFVRVPPEDLQAVLTWRKNVKAKAMSGINGIVGEILDGIISEIEGIIKISNLLTENALIKLVNGPNPEKITEELAKNFIDVERRKRKVKILFKGYSMGMASD